MKRLLYFSILLSTIFSCININAQQQDKALTRQEKKALQQQIDSLHYVIARNAIDARAFVLEAERVTLSRGQTVHVNSNTNFVSVDGDDAVVQVAFNVPMSGPNGIGGVTVDGNLSDYKVTIDKDGDCMVRMSVMGLGISANVFIRLYNNSDMAYVTISPNFNPNRISLSGRIIPLEESNVYKARSF